MTVRDSARPTAEFSVSFLSPKCLSVLCLLPVATAKLPVPCSFFLSLFFLCVSLHTLLLPPDALRLLSSLSPAATLPPSPSFFFTVVVPSTVPHRYPKPCPCPSLLLLLLLRLAATASSSPSRGAPSTKHSVGPGVPRNMRNAGSPFQVLLCCSVLLCAAPGTYRVPCTLAPLRPFTPATPCTVVPTHVSRTHVPSRETRRTTKYVCVASPPSPSPSHPHHLEFVSNSSLLPFLQLTLSRPRADRFAPASSPGPQSVFPAFHAFSFDTALFISVSE